MGCEKRARPHGRTRNIVRICRDVRRKAKAHLEFSLLDHMGVLVMKDTERVELFYLFFSASVFTAENSPQEPQTSEVRKEGWRMEDLFVRVGLEIS